MSEEDLFDVNNFVDVSESGKKKQCTRCSDWFYWKELSTEDGICFYCENCRAEDPRCSECQ